MDFAAEIIPASSEFSTRHTDVPLRMYPVGITCGYNLRGLLHEVMEMESEKEFMNGVYQEISERLGEDVAKDMYQMFRGQQITFPMRFFSPDCLRKRIVQEYDGTNIKQLAAKYGYTEKSIRRMLKEEKK